MKRIYMLPHHQLVCNGSCQGLLTNGFGSYYAIAPKLSYQGWYQLNPSNWRMQKIIESITPLDEGDCVSLHHQFYGLRRTYKSGAQDTTLHYQKVLLYSTLKLKGRILLTLDGRESYDGSELGREYSVDIKEDFALVTFTQKDSKGKIIFQHYLGIKGVRNVEWLNNWKEKHYESDAKRKSRSNYWVCDALTFMPRHHVVFSYGRTPAEARTLADIAYFHFDDIMSNLHEQALRTLPNFENIPDKYLQAAGSCATWSLQSLYQRFSFNHRMFRGVLAGLPWFYQLWSRDELISLGGLLSLVKRHNDEVLLKELKRILRRHLKSITKGKLANRFPHSDLGSVDALGWLAKRVLDYLKITKSLKQLYTLFTLGELVFWFTALEKGLKEAKESYYKDGLFTNTFCETWMDTSYHDDGRVGYRIEIQALFCAVYDALIYLGKIIDSKKVANYMAERKTFKQRIRKKFLRTIGYKF